MASTPISDFVKHHFRHFNAATVVDAAEGWRAHLTSGKKMLLARGGAMSTAELGLSLAEMIRQDKIHAISCSANNLEEDLFNLVAHDHYVRIPNYRDLTPADERKPAGRGYFVWSHWQPAVCVSFLHSKAPIRSGLSANAC